MPLLQRATSWSVRAAVLGACLLVPLAACTSPQQAPPAAPSVTTESAGPAGPVPAGLDRFYAQPLTWGACAPYATSDDVRSAFGRTDLQCARLTVPLDYGKPQGDTITIGVLRHKASDSAHRVGALVLNPGGPGASGMSAAAGISSQVAGTDLGKRFDLVGFDPRGIGASEPEVTCLTDTERDQERSEDLDTDGSPAGVARQEAESKEFAAKCAQRTKYGTGMLANLGTRDVVRDMDVLRSALGEQKLTYLGYSYGTRLGSTYAEAFPQNVRAMVLDGAVDPNEDEVSSLVAQGRGFGVAFNDFTKWCAARQDCALGADPSAATRAFQDLVRPLIDHPVRLRDGRELTFDDATLGTIQALYSQQLWSPLNAGLNELKEGQGTTLMALADQYNERDSSGHYTNTQDAFTAIRCVDDPPVTDRAEILTAENRYDQAAPFLDDGRPNGAALDPCAFWPVPNTSQPHEPNVSGVPPVLVISTTNDPATPYQAGVNLAKAMKGALLTFEGTQHTVFLQGISCVDRIGSDYLINGTLPPEGARCTAQ
ncbi:pimeloyl-ACP methyl ester carboxylesterase [Amycolatopsis viridis]|uniref:Pimeloyl-ACP methyl ester carboxylesterase n=1 Tax=Amycolatopsis viridis TaxID=185678 RepID=A0ABX0SZ85_9PSEU|nr:pimeloyl-ACP methyl ester carboxylesterase [Amycolatopsis viridis]